MPGVDNVYTSDLDSGKAEAKDLKKALLEPQGHGFFFQWRKEVRISLSRIETVLERIEETFRCERLHLLYQPPLGPNSPGRPKLGKLAPRDEKKEDASPGSIRPTLEREFALQPFFDGDAIEKFRSMSEVDEELQPWLQNVLLEHRKNLEMHLIQLHEGQRYIVELMKSDYGTHEAITVQPVTMSVRKGVSFEDEAPLDIDVLLKHDRIAKDEEKVEPVEPEPVEPVESVHHEETQLEIVSEDDLPPPRASPRA
ncbi:unnamed protein product, partial [Cladocopium goreaui]